MKSLEAYFGKMSIGGWLLKIYLEVQHSVWPRGWQLIIEDHYHIEE
jgi:hypothetical protein